jgi:beta-phosphoglucomutase-like phosphatase (HAD superfamily)
MIKAILLDFNGVIIDDEPIQMKAYQELLAAENIALTDEQYYECLGMDDKAFVEAAYARVGRTPEPNKVLEITQHKTQKWRDLMAGRHSTVSRMSTISFVRWPANSPSVS